MYTYAGAQQALNLLGNGYICLFTTAPTQAGGFSGEVSGNGYARKPVGGLTITNGVAKNTNAITFDEPTGSWGTANYFGIASEATGGNLLYYGELKDASTQTQGVAINVGYIFIVRKNGLEISLDTGSASSN